MALRRVTIQDIADACGLSRNTVSKIFNGRGNVSPATRQLVLDKARELQYFPAADPAPAAPRTEMQTIVLLTSRMPADYHFGTFFIPAFADQLGREGYTLMMCEVSAAELRSRSLPAHLQTDKTAGLLTIELFDRDYLDMLCETGLPVILVDSFYGAHTSLLPCDTISMENTASTFTLTSRIIASGARRLGFVGDLRHCNSFYERWSGFCAALTQAGLPLDRSCCILDSDTSPYHDIAWLTAKFRAMPRLPDAFVCANDFLALHIMAALKQQGITIPGQIMVSGFDGTPQSAIVEPSLTTVQIPSAEIGRLAADLLLERIEHPDRPLQSTYVKTVPIWRRSTERSAV